MSSNVHVTWGYQMFEGKWAEKFLFMMMGGRANGQVCADGE